jgi:hypothetical protein
MERKKTLLYLREQAKNLSMRIPNMNKPKGNFMEKLIVKAFLQDGMRMGIALGIKRDYSINKADNTVTWSFEIDDYYGHISTEISVRKYNTIDLNNVALNKC